MLWCNGWDPADSQLALSTKFVPLLYGLLGEGRRSADDSGLYYVGQTLQIPAILETAESMLLPDGTRVRLEETEFAGCDLPGVYRLLDANRDVVGRYAVNMASNESLTTLRDPQELEQRGVQLGSQPSRQERLERERQMRDEELENQQKLWKFALLAGLVVLLLETVLAGRAARQMQTELGEA